MKSQHERQSLPITLEREAFLRLGKLLDAALAGVAQHEEVVQAIPLIKSAYPEGKTKLYRLDLAVPRSLQRSTEGGVNEAEVRSKWLMSFPTHHTEMEEVAIFSLMSPQLFQPPQVSGAPELFSRLNARLINPQRCHANEWDGEATLEDLVKMFGGTAANEILQGATEGSATMLVEVTFDANTLVMWWYGFLRWVGNTTLPDDADDPDQGWVRQPA